MMTEEIAMVTNYIQSFVYKAVHHCTTGCAVSNGGCDQICMQDSLGYNCSCLDGYTLGSDGKDCHYTESKFCNIGMSHLHSYVAMDVYCTVII